MYIVNELFYILLLVILHLVFLLFYLFFFFKQKTAYEMRISDWSSDVCSSDQRVARRLAGRGRPTKPAGLLLQWPDRQSRFRLAHRAAAIPAQPLRFPVHWLR